MIEPQKYLNGSGIAFLGKYKSDIESKSLKTNSGILLNNLLLCGKHLLGLPEFVYMYTIMCTKIN